MALEKAACKVRHLASKTMAVYVRWVEQFVRFHRDRTGGWQHPSQMMPPVVFA